MRVRALLRLLARGRPARRLRARPRRSRSPCSLQARPYPARRGPTRRIPPPFRPDRRLPPCRRPRPARPRTSPRPQRFRCQAPADAPPKTDTPPVSTPLLDAEIQRVETVTRQHSESLNSSDTAEPSPGASMVLPDRSMIDLDQLIPIKPVSKAADTTPKVAPVEPSLAEPAPLNILVPPAPEDPSVPGLTGSAPIPGDGKSSPDAAELQPSRDSGFQIPDPRSLSELIGDLDSGISDPQMRAPRSDLTAEGSIARSEARETAGDTRPAISSDDVPVPKQDDAIEREGIRPGSSRWNQSPPGVRKNARPCESPS